MKTQANIPSNSFQHPYPPNFKFLLSLSLSKGRKKQNKWKTKPKRYLHLVSAGKGKNHFLQCYLYVHQPHFRTYPITRSSWPTEFGLLYVWFYVCLCACFSFSFGMEFCWGLCFVVVYFFSVFEERNFWSVCLSQLLEEMRGTIT